MRLGHLLLRFWLGFGGGVGLGLVAFRFAIFDPRLPYSQVVTVGSLLAAVLALRRGGAPGIATFVAVGFTAWQFWIAHALPWNQTVSHVLFSGTLAAGILLIAELYQALHERGIRIGKFLLLGPALAGVYLAATPALTLWTVSTSSVLRDLLANMFLGVVIGDGIAFGVEMIDLVLDRPQAHGAGAPSPARK
ncbi:MAG: hypothetical protein HKO98_03555 [Gemmatimonadetes bacterium]|nr:hypothetical protein [Gemmatimonadota bacterium]